MSEGDRHIKCMGVRSYVESKLDAGNTVHALEAGAVLAQRHPSIQPCSLNQVCTCVLPLGGEHVTAIPVDRHTFLTLFWWEGLDNDQTMKRSEHEAKTHLSDT